MRDARAWLVDVETTGQVEPQVIEFAHAEIMTTPGPVFTLGEISAERFEPTKPIELGALAAHHILPQELEGCPPPPAKFDELPRFIVGHHVDYDWECLGSPEDVYRIDTLPLSREAWPGLDSYKLAALIYYIFPGHIAREMVREAHRGAVDVSLCFEVFKRVVAAIPDEITSWGGIWKASEAARVPKIMPISKEHKGKPIGEVPRDFAEWYSRQSDVDPYLIKAFENHGLLPLRQAMLPLP